MTRSSNLCPNGAGRVRQSQVSESLFGRLSSTSTSGEICAGRCSCSSAPRPRWARQIVCVVALLSLLLRGRLKAKP